MKTLTLILSAGAVATAALITACFSEPVDEDEEDLGSGEAHIEAVDPLEGTYAKQGGTPLHFVFKRGETKGEDSFFGEIEVDGEGQRASGSISVGRDSLGTTFTLTPEGTTKKAKTATAPTTPDGGAPTDTRALAQQAFSGTMHFLKIGKNETILVRGDANAKTAHYKKVKSWCATAADCAPDVQKTSLGCTSFTCTTKSVCACK